MATEGTTLNNHREAPPSYLVDGDMGRHGGGTLTSHSVEPTLEAYENIFGPSARDIKQDLQRFKRHGRWHLPDILKGPNQYLTDRVDGLITDATSSPFTSRILPYKYITNVDGKIKWNVWSFDEGLASRVPYESAARTLTQSKRSFAGYFIRQGMAIVLEHNFMMTEAGRENFRRQLNQLVGSIQLTNDLDVHVALILAPSYQKTMNEKYLSNDKSAAQICREFVELFGFVQKNQNALDILIEEAKSQLRTWGGPMPDFMLCNSKLTFQLTMTPDVTNYVTQGPEGQKKLKTGPTLSSYRGIGIVHTRAFSMETGAPPRDMLRRRVRVAEYYRITPHKDNHKRVFQLYNEERDTFENFNFHDLLKMAICDEGGSSAAGGNNNNALTQVLSSMQLGSQAHPQITHAVKLGEQLDVGSKIQLFGDLTEFFKQQMLLKAPMDWSWSPYAFNSDIVFVPGSLDLADFKNTVAPDINAGTIANFPEFVKTAMLTYLNEKVPGGAPTIKESRKLKVIAASLAPYHRNFVALNFLKKLTGVGAEWNANANACERPDNWDTLPVTTAVGGKKVDSTAFSTVMTGDAEIKAHYMLYLRLQLRNYLRFGVPTALLNGAPQDSSKLETSLNLNVDWNNMRFMNQTLRDKGAWFCPNHFKFPDESFSGFGEWLGYHMLLSTDFVATCARGKGALTQDNYHSETLLMDMIKNKTSYTVEYGQILAALQAAHAAFKNSTQKRGDMYVNAGIPIMTVLQGVGTWSDQNISYNGVNAANTVMKPYWMFPRTTSTQQEVFCNTGRSGWKTSLWNEANFKADLDFTDRVCQWIAGNIVSAAVDCPNRSISCQEYSSITNTDVNNFLRMIAWRLWADQEIPVTAPGCFNTVNRTWPEIIENALFPQLAYSFAHPGHGLMMYGDPSMAIGGPEQYLSKLTEDIEVVIVRPNIEHHMLGIILGQGGEGLGSTFWGQTELSCYDDSMHGIWGMSYKYHERAIVINERNLIRLWDIAYDGYVGGKDCSYVHWDSMEDDPKRDPHSVPCFMQATTDVTRPYRGPSMMVMAFHHGIAKNQSAGMGTSVFKRDYKSNWPSPVVFYDRLESMGTISAMADFENIHAVECENFRVFNNDLYANAYKSYREKMPNFYELHIIRKNAGLAAVENEVSSDALAFQGTMRVLSADTGGLIQEVQGSGHHGPDFVGCSSLRAGKGYRINSQPTIQRLV